MIGIFRQKNPGNTLFLLIYGLVLKFPSFLNPSSPVVQEEDHYLYNWLLNFLAPLNMPAVLYTLLAFIFLLVQATLLNRVCNALKILPKPTYLPAMSYLLVTSLIPEWNQFSSPLIINTLLIWIIYRMANLYMTTTANYSVFNVGLIMGFITLFYEPAIVFVLLIPFTLFVMRPFRIREWLIGFLGVTTPYYFLGVILFLTDNFRWNKLLPIVDFDFPAIPSSIFVTISIALLVLPFIIGGFFVQDNLNKMLIQVRKNWSLLLLFLIISMLIILVNGGDEYVNWIACLIPLSAFHAAAYYYPDKRKFPIVMHWVVFLYAVFVNYAYLF